ncbi:outer membrane porin, OprD family [Pseudomonas extremaustralis]|uniref:OprD family outer membrane porin n=1 Tax=Pseudomonas extremaustralis TaxID=359110 RepID=UPI00099C17B0|nr:outer membrane porin, OprD family [Pseudomonas extremaustralis]
MKKILIAPVVLAATNPVYASFIDDANVILNARNFYFSRDFRQSDAVQPKREEWAQGFILKAMSGYTEGTIGFGLDLYGALGVKLDSSNARAGTGLLPNTFGNSGPNEYTDLSGVFKTRLSKTEVKFGGFTPKSPVPPLTPSRVVRIQGSIYRCSGPRPGCRGSPKIVG